VKVIVGLGNPGREYAATRHNVGWMALDRLADRAGWNVRVKDRDAAATVRGRYADLDLVLVKPLTFMNDSGIAVRKVLARERVPLEQMLVVVDDFALPFGRIRIRPEGSAGGHNGLRSIIGELGTERFARLRIGIGEPRRTAIDHVLSRFTADERAHLPDLLDAAVDAVETWAREGPEAASSRWNGWKLDGPSGAPPGSLDPHAPAGRGSGHPGADALGAVASDGIVRTRTGWRRLLPELRGREPRDR
jgi:peptidyl-tRNA hydrolase, PTH1 family